MFRRKLYDELLAWKREPVRENALLIEGGTPCPVRARWSRSLLGANTAHTSSWTFLIQKTVCWRHLRTQT